MDPQQPMSPIGGQNPYDFIMDSNKKQKKSLLPSPSDPKQKLLYLVAGGGLLLALLALIVMIFFSGSGGVSAGLTPIAQKQTEIIRVSNLGTQKTRSSAAQTLAENTYLTTISAQKTTLAYISKKGKAPTSKILALGLNSQTDTKLKSAELAGQYDEVFVAIIKADLVDYQKALATEYKATNIKSEKVLLKSLYDQVTIILKGAQ